MLTYSKALDVRYDVDIFVAGGGPSGCAAAIAAARSGASVLLVERQNCLGGMWTSGLVNPLFDYKNKGGLVQEIVDRLDAAGQSVLVAGGMYDFDIEEMKYLLDSLCKLYPNAREMMLSALQNEAQYGLWNKN